MAYVPVISTLVKPKKWVAYGCHKEKFKTWCLGPPL